MPPAARLPVKPTFFARPRDFRAWLEAHHEAGRELWVGFHKKGSGRPSITWPEAVDEALCFGWIDGIRKSVDEQAYVIRFTPRRRGSRWSAVNVARVRVLARERRMRPAGRAAFEARTAARTDTYSYEQRHVAKLSPALAREFRAKAKAWAFFAAQPPGYRHLCIWWIVSAKKDETQRRRLATLIQLSAKGERLPMLGRPTGTGRS
jgi:uncharacterized protein YdeI (YjbR/CyaY-like superfamily)